MNLFILNINFLKLSSFFPSDFMEIYIFFHGPMKVLWMLGTVPPVSPTAQNESRTNQLRELAMKYSEN